MEDVPCPHCEADVPASEDEKVLICPACGEQFFAPEPIRDFGEESDAEARAALERSVDRSRDLDSIRIRALSAERRAAYRQRSFLIVAVIGCGLAIYELVDRLVTFPLNWRGKFADVTLIIGCVIGIRFFVEKIRAIQQELVIQTPEEPDTPPDFSTLRDGSQVWGDLAAMTNEKREDE